MIITSRENKIYKAVKSLMTKRGRDENGLFIIEGARSVSDAIKKNAQIEYIIKEDGVNINEGNFREFIFAPKLFRELSDTLTPQGIMAVCKMPDYTLSDIKGGDKSAVILCESLQDPGNIGTIIRTAHAAFCDGVILTKGCCDLYNPKIVRATMSGIFSVPVICGANAEEVLAHFKNCGYESVAGALSEESRDLYSTPLTGKKLIVVGNEGNGISDDTLKLCDKVVKIPMRSDAESLNVAIATSVIVYEHYRQNQA